MPRYIPSIPFDDCFGSVGELTFYHNRGKCYYRRRSRPGFPGTMLQMEHQTVHLRAIDAWQHLPHSVQLEWNAIAPDVIVHRPPFDGTTHMSGYNLFVSAYHGYASLGNEHVPVPVPWEEFPVHSVDGVDTVSVVDGSLQLGFRIWMEESVEAGRFALLVRLQLTKPGGGLDAGKMRNFRAEGNLPGGWSVATVNVEDYLNIWDLELPAYRVHLRHVLLDRRSGYRNIYSQKSYEIVLP